MTVILTFEDAGDGKTKYTARVLHWTVADRKKWYGFTPKAICDASKVAEVPLCLSCERRLKVDEPVTKAAQAGGSKDAAPTDYGFMYQHGFQDPDGHHWEFVHMSAIPPNQLHSKLQTTTTNSIIP